MSEQQMTIEEAMEKMRFPKPKMSSDEAAKKAVEAFIAESHSYKGKPMLNQCSCQTLRFLGEAYDLPLKEMHEWIAVGLHERRLTAMAIGPYGRDLMYSFQRKFGSLRCGELTGAAERTPEEAERVGRLRLWEERCAPLVDYVVRSVVRWGERSRPAPPVPQGLG